MICNYNGGPCFFFPFSVLTCTARGREGAPLTKGEGTSCIEALDVDVDAGVDELNTLANIMLTYAQNPIFYVRALHGNKSVYNAAKRSVLCIVKIFGEICAMATNLRPGHTRRYVKLLQTQ